MTAYDSLRLAGAVLLALSGILVVVAVRMYVVRDIRGVKEDLRGKRRQHGMQEAEKAASLQRAKTSGLLLQEDIATQLVATDDDATLVGSQQQQSVQDTHTSAEYPFVITQRQLSLGTEQVIEEGEER